MQQSRPNLVFMGASGSGKTRIGLLAANELGFQFVDADDLHPQANIEKMSKGIALDDADRWPWLDSVGQALANSNHLVMACSALKRSYRDRIRLHNSQLLFVELTVPRDALAARLSSREDHFMPVSLLGSQLEALEPIAAEEPGFQVNADQAPDAVIAEFTQKLNSVLQ